MIAEEQKKRDELISVAVWSERGTFEPYWGSKARNGLEEVEIRVLQRKNRRPWDQLSLYPWFSEICWQRSRGRLRRACRMRRRRINGWRHVKQHWCRS